MKRYLSLALAVLLAFSLVALVGCGSSSSSIKTGLGIVTNISRSKAATADAAGTAEAYSTIAVVTFDATGKITKCTLDAAQTQIQFDATGKITTDLATIPQTKDELGDAYGMKKASSIGKEWNEQAAAFAMWCVGKTADQVKGMQLKDTDSEKGVPNEADLTASVTVSVGDFIAAIQKASANAQPGAVSGNNYKSGLGVVTNIARSKDATADAAGVAEAYSTLAAVTVDGSGKIVACSIDAAQTQVKFDTTGAITSDMTAPVQSKDELGDAYGMKKASSIGKEWNEQAAAFAQWCVGKTLSEVQGLKVKDTDTEKGVPDSADLAASVTVSVSDFLAAVTKAVNNAA